MMLLTHQSSSLYVLSVCVALLKMPFPCWAFFASPRVPPSFQNHRAAHIQDLTSMMLSCPGSVDNQVVMSRDASSMDMAMDMDIDSSMPLLLEALQTILFSPESHQALMEEISSCKDDCWTKVPVREIQAGRYEIFLARAREHRCEYALQLMEQVIERLSAAEDKYGGIAARMLLTDPQEIIDLLVQDATMKARNASPSLTNDAEFENFSILVNFGSCDAQPMHIDGIVTQGVYFITDESPTTKTWQPKKNKLSTMNPRTVTDMWSKMLPSIDESVLEEIRLRLEKQDQPSGLTAKECIRRYGGLFLSFEDLNEESQRSVPSRTVRVVPPNGLHAGPACHDKRVVMFFSERVVVVESEFSSSSSSSSPSSSVESYNPDVQRTAIQLLVEVLSKIWPNLSVDARHAMLHLLRVYIRMRPQRPTEFVVGPGVTNIVQWLYDCNADLQLASAATEMINVVATSGKYDFREACAYYVERGKGWK